MRGWNSTGKTVVVALKEPGGQPRPRLGRPWLGEGVGLDRRFVGHGFGRDFGWDVVEEGV
jgi:hypothetical protein